MDHSPWALEPTVSPLPGVHVDDLDHGMRIAERSPSRSSLSGPTPGMRWGAAGRYAIERCIGSGGMGTVFEAKDGLLGRVVALKVLHCRESDEVDRGRILREARLAALVGHERIATVYEVGEHEGTPFVAMELVRGATLRSSMRHGPVAPFYVLKRAVEIAEALAELHEHDVIHRDLKPENVMLSDRGRVKLLDFGLARQHPLRVDGRGDHAGMGSAAESAPALSGTPGYMAPERFEGRRLDPRVDVFALGVILYELVTGMQPFQGASFSELLAAIRGARNPGMPEGSPVAKSGVPWSDD